MPGDHTLETPEGLFDLPLSQEEFALSEELRILWRRRLGLGENETLNKKEKEKKTE